MILQLPKWVEIGALILAFVAGFVNVIGLISFEHQSVSHLSGTATLLGTGLLNSSLANIMHLLGVLLSFLLGSIIAGLILQGTILELGKHYDTALFLESILLLLSLLLLSSGSMYGQFFASAACGLQNALATKYSGAVIRTTHLTGIFTDLGLVIGEFFKGQKLDKRKVQLFLIIIFGFIFGATFGSFMYLKYQFMALLFPVIICLLMAIIYKLLYRNLYLR